MKTTFFVVAGLLAGGFGLKADADVADKIYLMSISNYGDRSWITGANNWSSGEVPDKDHDYIIDGRQSGGSTISFDGQTFGGRSLQFGDPGTTKGRGNAFVHRGKMVLPYEGLILAAGSMTSWAGDGTSDESRNKPVIVSGTVTVTALASAPFRFYSGKEWNTFRFPDAFVGEEDAGISVQCQNAGWLIVQLENAAGYKGSLAYADPSGSGVGYGGFRLNQASLKGITFKEGAHLYLSDATTANTIGDLVGAAGAETVLEKFPGGALTITNAVSGDVLIRLPGWNADYSNPAPRTSAWTNEYPILTLAKGVDASAAQIEIHDDMGLSFLPGIRHEILCRTNDDTSVSYVYSFAQDKPAFISATSRDTGNNNPNLADFWEPSELEFVAPTNEAAANYYYYVTTGKNNAQCNFSKDPVRTPLFYVSITYSALSWSQFTFDGDLVIGGNYTIYNWNANLRSTFKGRVTTIGSHKVLANPKHHSAVTFDTLFGDENAEWKAGSDWVQFTDTDSVVKPLTDVGFGLTHAEGYRGSLTFNQQTRADGYYYLTLGNTGDSSLNAVTVSSNFTIRAVAATDSTTVKTLAMGENNKLRPIAADGSVSCVTVTDALTLGAPLTILGEGLDYPRPDADTRYPVLRWKKDAADLDADDFVIDNTGATHRGAGHTWQLWEDGDYTCYGIVYERQGLMLIFR